MSSQYIFTMHRLSKVHPPDKTVLENITLAFYPGREDRRSRLQRRRQVHAAADHGRGRPGVPRRRRARPRGERRDARAGADARREQGRPRQRRGRRRRDEGAARPLQRAGGRLLGGERGGVRAYPGSDRSRRRLEPRHPARLRDGRSAPAAGQRRRLEALGRRAPARGAVPAAAGRAGPAAARRAHQPPRRRVGRLARAAPGGVQGHDRRRHPRPLLPRQRRRLDTRARPRPRHPLRGQLLGLARAEAGAAGSGRAHREGPPAHDRGRARMGADEPQGAAHEVEGPPGALRASSSPKSATSGSRTSRSTSRPGRAWARRS